MSFRNGRLITGKNTFGSPMEVEGPMLLDRVELVAPPAGSPEPEDPRVEIPDGNREGQTATAAVVDGIADLSSHLEQPHPVAVVHEYVEGNGSPEAVAVLIDDTTMDRDAIVAETPVDRNHEAVVKETRKWLVVGRKRKWIRFLLLSVILSAVVAIGIGVYYALTPADQTVSTPEGPLSTLESIQARGFLNCGIPEDDGQLLMDGGSVFSNFSIDLCKALAAAIFGSATSTLILPEVSPADRFIALNNGTVDVLASWTTYTMERQVYENTTRKGFSFSTPYLYNGLTFGGVPPFGSCAINQITKNTTNAVCANMTVCVVQSTTYVDVVKKILPNVKLLMAPSTEAFYWNFGQGNCNVLAGDQFETANATVISMGYFDKYEVADDVFSKEPLALVTRQDDSNWSDFVNWVIQALLFAEKKKFTQDRAALFPVQEPVFGEQYKNMFSDAIAEVGHYGEIYDRTLEQVVPRKAVNTINNGTTGLLYPMPFGSSESNGADPVSGSTLQTIRDRGYLSCGITERAIFSEYSSTGSHLGFSIDFCLALTAAIFNKTVGKVQYRIVDGDERFLALARKDVDVLSCITTVTLSRDVFEMASKTGFSFSQPNFYDVLNFGGIPPYGNCAGLQSTDGNCTGLKICVGVNTTYLDVVQKLFLAKYIVTKATQELAAQGLGYECNAIAGGVGDLAERNIRLVGQYNGPYEKGAQTKTFSDNPIALVTRQDDPVWSAFVYWIVSATFSAEENPGNEVPIVNLFGSQYVNMLKDAITEVGSFADIYNRNVKSELPRAGPNLLNKNPLQAEHNPLPGLEN